MLLAIVKERQAGAKLQLGRFYLRPVHRRLPAARRYLADVKNKYPETASSVVADVLLAGIEPASAPPAAPASEQPVAAAPPRAPRRPSPPAPAKPKREPVQPEQMRPEHVRKNAASAPLNEQNEVRKWLLPLPDLNR